MAQSAFETQTANLEPYLTASPSAVATADFANLTSTGFDYLFVYELVPATDGVNLLIRTSTDNGSTFDSGASDYNYSFLTTGSGDTSTTGASSIIINGTAVGSDTNEGLSGAFTLINPSSTNYTRLVGLNQYTDSTPNNRVAIFGGTRASAADVDAIRFLFSSGNIESGEIRVYRLLAS